LPSETECGCVLTPANYDDYRRENCASKVDGKCLDHVYGIDDGESELHSLRYRLSEGWTNDSARSHCESRDGDFEPAESQEDSMEQQQRSRKKYLSARIVAKSVDDAGNVIPRYRFTSDNMDEYGDIITRKATEKAVEAWRQWRNIRLQHDTARPIGKAIRIGEADGLAWNEMDVRVDDPTVIPLIEGDDPVLGAASVGIIVNDFEVNEDEEAQELSGWWEPWIITDYDMIEISLVDHPANYDAVRVEGEEEEESGRDRLMMFSRNATERANAPEANLPPGTKYVDEDEEQEDMNDKELEEETTEAPEEGEEVVEEPAVEEEPQTEPQEPEPEETKGLEALLDRNLEATQQLGQTISEKLDKLIDVMSGEEEAEEEAAPAEESDVETEPVEEPTEVEEEGAGEAVEPGEELDEDFASRVADLAAERVREALAGGEPEGEQEAKELAEGGISEERVRELIQEAIDEAKQLKPRKTDVVVEEEDVEKALEVDEGEEGEQEPEPADPGAKLRAAVARVSRKLG
jgi:hypothetical protein